VANAFLVSIEVRCLLARRLSIKYDGLEIGKTPMLVPSLSSRINMDLIKINNVISETIEGPILVSAYDLMYSNDFSPFPESTLVFVDSGGYECAKSQEISDFGFYRPDPYEWNRYMHAETIKKLETIPTKIVISYDHPNEKSPVKEQIENANNLFKKKEGILKEFLIKPECIHPSKINMESVIQNINPDNLAAFDIVGFTEKELGFSIFERMIAIANIRREMDKQDLNIPIHIFGSLDPIITPLYYLSGADIFDGLAWMRFIFSTGRTLHYESFGPYHFENGIHENTEKTFYKTLSENYKYIIILNNNLKEFQTTGDYNLLSPDSNIVEFIKRSYFNMLKELEAK